MTAPVSEERIRELQKYHAGAEKVLYTGSPFRAIHADSAAICTELLAARREWQPIETAPKNREFLACSKTLRPFIAHWGNPLGWLDSVGLQRDPTHWRHLPPPPETAV